MKKPLVTVPPTNPLPLTSMILLKVRLVVASMATTPPVVPFQGLEVTTAFIVAWLYIGTRMSCTFPATENGLQRLEMKVMVLPDIEAILVNSKLPAEPNATTCPKLAVLL